MERGPTDRELYQCLAAALMRLVPKNWTSAWIEAELQEDVGTAKVFCMTATDGTVRLDPGFETYDVIDQTFLRLRSQMCAAGKPAWRKARFSVEPDGRFHADFDYAG